MTTHSEHILETPAPQLAPARPPRDDDWRLSRTAKPLRTWRLSK